ncbi:MAG: hypothetical protein GYA71_05715 [Bacteroidales bacterium]|nr:hypothetical protein [Bacteroidales bacterium]
MKKGIIFAFFLLFLIKAATAQDTKFLTDKQGEYIVKNQLNKCPGFDFATYSGNLKVITDWFHINNPVLNPIKGFDAIVIMGGNLCDDDRHSFYYGVMSYIHFAFYYFYMQNGEMKQATGWSAHGTEININNPIHNIGQIMDESEFKTGDPPALKQPLEKALANLKQFYLTNPVEREISPGVILFKGGYILVFNPDRPWIWKPVTVREIVDAELAYYRVKKEIDSINYQKTLEKWAKLNFKPPEMANTSVYDVLKKEYSALSSEELNKPASVSRDDGDISGIRADGVGMPVMRFNPDCWDRALPPTAIQFISFEYKPASYEELQQFIKRNDGLTDYVSLFMNKLPFKELGALINKK